MSEKTPGTGPNHDPSAVVRRLANAIASAAIIMSADDEHDESFAALLERSSLGTAGARSLKARVDDTQVMQVRHRMAATTKARTKKVRTQSVRPYEIVVVFDPDFDEVDVVPSVQAIFDVVVQDGGSIRQINVLGRYPLIDTNRAEGTYVAITALVHEAALELLQEQLRGNAAVLHTTARQR